MQPGCPWGMLADVRLLAYPTYSPDDGGQFQPLSAHSRPGRRVQRTGQGDFTRWAGASQRLDLRGVAKIVVQGNP